MKWTQFVSQYKILLICSLAIAISGSSIVSLSIPKTYCSIKQISINASEDKLEKATAKLKILFNNPTIEPSKVTTEPEIINELLKSPKLFLLMGEEYVKTSKNKKLKLKDYLSLSREPWWCRLFNSQEEQSKIRRCLMTEVDLKTGIISIKGSAQDPFVAYEITQIASKVLQSMLQAYTRNIAIINTDNTRNQCLRTKKNYDKSLAAYAKYVDSNTSPTSMEEMSIIDSLQKNVDIALEEYNKANLQYHMAEMKVKRHLINFITLKDGNIAKSPEHPRTFVNLIIWLFYAILFDFWSISIHNKISRKIHGKR